MTVKAASLLLTTGRGVLSLNLPAKELCPDVQPTPTNHSAFESIKFRLKKLKKSRAVKDAYICEVHVSHGYEAPTVFSIQRTAIRAVGKTNLFIGFGGVGNDVI